MKILNKGSAKDRKKAVRSVLQGIFLLLLLYIIVTALYSLQRYVPYEQLGVSPTGDAQGFIAISYFGVDRDGTGTLISTPLLEKHLQALRASGYVTISQQDILDYYNEGKPLPERALYLMFEDGRRDTAIFAQKIMEQFNFLGTINSYADKFSKKDSKFLMPEDLLELEKSTFWELGSNGYRLEYINVFDRHGNYLGEMDALRFAEVSQYLDRNYDHYLMDFIRDESKLPKESKEEMGQRIRMDYEKMQAIYTNEIGKMPKIYVLMHANTGQFGTNIQASRVNERCIKETFEMNFNREGHPLNIGESIYDLTRMQPQSYWSTNHLLMRIWDDTRQPMQFISGDSLQSSKWELKSGAAEFKEDEICVTTLPGGTGNLRLRGADYRDLNLSVKLNGNKFGSQSVLLRSDRSGASNIRVELVNNHLVISQTIQGTKEVLKDIDLYVYDGIIPESMQENKKAAEVVNLESELKNTESAEEKARLTSRLNDRKELAATSVSEGAISYLPTIELSERGSRLLEIKLKGEELTVSIDKKIAVDHLTVKMTDDTGLELESENGGASFSQRNLTDNVYDGIFKKVLITELDKKTVLYTNRLDGFDAVAYKIKESVNRVVNWFIHTL